ncbi:MAG: carbohydrate ABC transporter permease [Solobacterium sp.]|nr:carbohydrate ABC transporter permease [Solobacterium sp.]
MKRKRWIRAFHIVILIAILFIILMPLYYAVILSFDRTAVNRLPDFTWTPIQPSTYNYEVLHFFIDVLSYFRNTFFLTLINTFISVMTALVSGYAFAKGRFFGKKFWYLILLAVMMLPFESRMIPLYMIYYNIGLLNTYWPLILGQFTYVYGIFFARTFNMGIPDSLREAAMSDGASEWRIFLQIILPLCKPIAATLAILQAIAHWNNYLWPLIVLKDYSKQVISVGVALFSASVDAIYYGPRMALAVLSAVPMIIVFLFLQKYIVQSIAVTGIKQ